MPRKRTVSDIKSTLLRPALTSDFEVQIALPTADGFTPHASIIDQDRMQLMCCDASLPGSNLATYDVNNDRHGVTERHAYRRVYDDRIDLEFFVDAEKYMTIRFFERWIDAIMLQDGVDSANPISQDYSYRVRYSDDYVSSSGLKVRKFERDHASNIEYTFVNAYPFTISSMPVSYDSSSLLKCTVSFSYLRYVVNEIGTPADSQQSPGSKSTPALKKQSEQQSKSSLLNSDDDIIKRGKVGDQVTKSYAAELLAFARGETGS